jgi:CHAT domain-containing protein
VAELGRARSLLDTLTESKARITKGLTAQQRERQTALLAALSKASAALLKESSAANRRALVQAEQALSDWVIELRRSNPAFLELQYPESYDAARVQREAARRGSAIIEYSLGERRSEAWLVTGNGFEMVSLPSRAVIEKEVRQFRDVAASRPRGGAALQAWRVTAERLYGMLIEPVRRRLPPGQPLIVVPDGILHYLPFEVLLQTSQWSRPPGLRGDQWSRPPGLPGAPPVAAGRFLIEDHDITYAPSASSLGSLPGGAGAKPRELLAFGDPVFSPGQARPTEVAGLVRGVYDRAGIGLPQLPSTRIEVERLAALYPAERRRIYLGSDASEAALKRERLADYRGLHFATHAVLDEEVPSRSGVVLSLVNPGSEDGVLQLNEIFNLELGAEMVVLSACQTGLGKLVRGEGMIGLTRAFLYAGCPRVVVSLWEVNDLATADFMAAFYGAMRRGVSPAAALRQAKLSFLASDTPAYRHPYFWAPFILTGAR